MIFVTVGTVQYPFVRMVRIIEKLLETTGGAEKIVFQHGYTPVTIQHKSLTAHPLFSHNAFARLLKQSRIIISHAGPATIYESLRYGKKPWVLPRDKKHGEHVNSHQVCFARFMSNKHLIFNLSETKINTMIRHDRIPSSSPRINNPTKIVEYLNTITQPI